MRRFLVVRHGQSEWNAMGRWQGWADVPLSDLGAEQACQAGQALAAEGVRGGLVFSSDLARARVTAELLGAEIGYHGPVRVDEGLREHDVGHWTGLTNDELAVRFPRQLEDRFSGRLDGFPGGERADTFTARVGDALERLAQVAYQLEDGDLVAVAHGGVIMVIEQLAGVWSPDRRHPNLSGWWLEVTGEPPEVGWAALSPVQLLDVPVPETVTEVA